METEKTTMPNPSPVVPRYPVYIPSKGRPDTNLTANCLLEAGVPFHIVVEPPEEAAYARRYGTERLIVLPFHDLGLGSIPARNFIWEHAKASGAERHWTLDDNIRHFSRRYQAKRFYCDAGIALRVCEDFTERYENIAISGLQYNMFVPDHKKVLPLQINCHVYSCMLIRNDLPYRWRGRYNEDTDLCLQVLSAGWCTVLLNTFTAQKIRTMAMKGGNSDVLYQDDGRLHMARSLERMWPGVVETKRRFQRPQHVIFDGWKRFDTPLKFKPGIDPTRLPPIDEYGMSLVQVRPEVKSPRLRSTIREYSEKQKRMTDAQKNTTDTTDQNS
jgi:hypothetical protein